MQQTTILNKLMLVKRMSLLLILYFSFYMHAHASHSGSEKQISGKVIEASSQEGLPSLTVTIKGTSIGTLTNIDGEYTIRAKEGDVLVFSFIGYKTVEIEVTNQAIIDIELEADIMGLDEVVVTGYGRQKKSDLTGAISSVSSDVLNEMPVLNVEQALQGRAAGVSITQNTGMPGGSSSIQIRGISSINGTQPLVIVDGVRSSLNNLNTADIESIEILKDASSAAIYGASGGNGVILVTTKKGKAGKPTVNFDYYIGSQKPWKSMDMMNSGEYTDYMNMVSAIKGKEAFTTQPDTFQYYNWQENMIKPSLMQNYNLSVSGGSEKSNFFMSANYKIQNGIVDKSDFKQLGFRINSDHQINKLIKIGENVSFTQTISEGYEEWEFQSEYFNPIPEILRMYPYIEPYDENGDWSVAPDGGNNPIVTPDVMNKQRTNYSIGGNAYVDITPIKGFILTSKINSYANFNINDQFNPIYEYSPTVRNERNSVSKSQGNEKGWQWQNYINYETSFFSDHNVGLMAGFESGQSSYNDMSGERFDLINESQEMWYFDASTNDTLVTQIVQGGGWEDAAYAYFGRLNYDYRGKYLLTANIRKDYSSRFGPNNRSGLFPSFSVGWKFTEEAFMDNLSFISFGKLRFGYGETGANAPGRYGYYSSVNSNLPAFNYILNGGINSQSGAALQQMPNPEMAWETMIMSNLGLDLTFFENQLSFTADFFKKQNDGMLIYQSLPSITGMYQYAPYVSQLGGEASPITNIGKFDNSGIELSLGYKNGDHAVKTAFDFNFTYVENKVIDIQGDSLYNGNVGVNFSNILLTAEGESVVQFYGYETNGLFQESDAAVNSKGKVYIKNQPYTIKTNGDTAWAQSKAKPGDLIFVDQNGDGKITSADRKNIGNPIPKFIFGFSTNLEYKNFDLTMFFEGKFGYQIFNGSKYFLMDPNVSNNRLTDVLDQYRPDLYDDEGNLLFEGNTDTDLPRLDPKDENNNFTKVSDFFVESGNYVRLKNIQIGYNINPALLSKAKIERLRIYVGARNLLTITKYSGMDPEIGNSNPLQMGIDKAGNYPQNRMFLAGISVKF